MALDSLYDAWFKAHYPLEYYITLLSGHAAKGDKDHIVQVKTEMKRGFGIQITPTSSVRTIRITLSTTARVLFPMHRLSSSTS